MTIQNIHQVSDAHPTVELAMAQLSHMLDEILAGLDTPFEVNGGTPVGSRSHLAPCAHRAGGEQEHRNGAAFPDRGRPGAVRGFGHAVGLPQQRRPQVGAHLHACSR
jgi:hypothetical protein